MEICSAAEGDCSKHGKVCGKISKVDVVFLGIALTRESVAQELVSILLSFELFQSRRKGLLVELPLDAKISAPMEKRNNG